MKIAIFGAGLIGRRRGSQLGEHTLVGIYDSETGRARALAAELSTNCFESEDALLASSAELVIIATFNSALQPLAVRSLRAGKHVLLEKPGAVSVEELLELLAVAEGAGKSVKVGFNLRFHPAIQRLKTLVDEGALGELMFLRARYGHGGRLHMEREWRFQPDLSGGGELLDQGVHLLDLIYWILGPVPYHSSLLTKSFWESPVEDNAVMTLRDARCWATFHVSCSEWKNTFALELYGRKGKVLVEGLGGSYGQESLTYYRMLPEMGPPVTSTETFAEADASWLLDLQNLVNHIQHGTPLWGDLQSATYAMTQIRRAYHENGFHHLCCAREASGGFSK